jgi:hypothetical protein
MAQIKIEDETVMIRLSRAEKFGALRGNLRFPLSAVRSARVVDKPFAEIQGFRSPGTRVPGIMALGTWRRRGGERDFVAVIAASVASSLRSTRTHRAICG